MVIRNQGKMPPLDNKNVQVRELSPSQISLQLYMGETQWEMMDNIKELKSFVSKPSEENDRHPQKESATTGKGSEQKRPSFVTQEDVVVMLEKELSRSQED
ncbi:unnamed protein product [Prunus armeniaca]